MARGNILAGPPKFSWGPSGEKIFEFFFSKMVHCDVLLFLADGGAPKRRGARVANPLYPTLSTGLPRLTLGTIYTDELRRKLITNAITCKNI